MSATAPSRALAAQARFRALLTALSRPGTTAPLGEPAPSPLPGAGHLLAVAETLLDHEVAFCVVGDGLSRQDAAAFAEEVRLRTGSQPAAAPAAQFVFVFGRAGDALDAISPGTAEFPDDAATLLWHVPENAPATPVRVSGPGIEHETEVALPAIAADEIATLVRINAAYPCGLDTFFVAATGNVTGLPRSTRVRPAGSRQ